MAVPAFLGVQARPSPERMVQPPVLDQPPFQAARTNYDEVDTTDTVQVLALVAVPSRHHPGSHPRVQQKTELRGSCTWTLARDQRQVIPWSGAAANMARGIIDDRLICV